MKLSPDELRKGYQEATVRPARSESRCPESDLLSRAAVGDLGETDRERLLDHVASCSDCAEELRLAFGARSSEVGDSVVPLSSRRPAPWRASIFLAAAAALLLAGGLAVQQRRSTAPPADEAPFRQEDSRAGIVSLVPREARLPRTAAVLRWKGPSDHAHYRVMVATEDLNTLATGESLVNPVYRVPPEVLAPLPRGARIIWKVVTVMPDGTRVGSRTFVNEID
ncbi:MAG: zf-HC2 domain-containing protein [Acidobacteriota bacterium]